MIETWLTNDGSDFPLARSPWRVNPLAARPHTMSTDDVKKITWYLDLIAA